MENKKQISSQPVTEREMGILFTINAIIRLSRKSGKTLVSEKEICQLLENDYEFNREYTESILNFLSNNMPILAVKTKYSEREFGISVNVMMEMEVAGQ
jgi:hypothetical protein